MANAISSSRGLPRQQRKGWYIDALEALYLVEGVPAWTKTDYQRVGTKDKLFMTDCGLMSAILDWRMDQVRFDADRSGKLAETLAFNELMAHVDNDENYELYHYAWVPDSAYGIPVGLTVTRFAMMFSDRGGARRWQG